MIATEVIPQGLRVKEANPQKDRRWEAFVAEHPNGSIYHHPAWLEVLEREYGQKGIYFTCEDGAGRVLAILPMLQTRGLPFGLQRSLTGRRLSSLPRTPVAGPLSVDSQATVAVLEEAVRRVSGSAGLQLQVKTHRNNLDGLIDGVTGVPWRKSYVLRLPETRDQPFRIRNSQNRAKIKWAINKASRLGVSAQPAETELDLLAWYRIYLETMRNTAVLPRPYRFFYSLWELLKPRGMMELLLAVQEINGRRRILAGSIFLSFGHTVSYAFNGSRASELALRPNDVIQWYAINQACNRGFRYFDFGEVPEGHHDLAKFKSKWGAEPERLYRYYYPARAGFTRGHHSESQNYSDVLGKMIWRRLPLSTISWIGDRIYAYL